MNAGKYNRKIQIFAVNITEDSAGFQAYDPALVLTCYASVKTTRGMTLIRNGTDFEKAYTNFTIRKPHIPITRDMKIVFRDKTYTIEYLNDIDEAGVELEMQCKEITLSKGENYGSF